MSVPRERTATRGRAFAATLIAAVLLVLLLLRSPSSGQLICVGDCNGDHSVVADELITLLDVNLGNVESSACPHGLLAAVNVAVILEAVGNAVNRCPQPPTDTPTSTATSSATFTLTPTATSTTPPTPTVTPTPSTTPNGPRFVDNGDGTITDHETGLIWEKKSNDGSVHDKDNQYTWSLAAPWGPTGTVFTQFLAALNGQRFAGYTDWRLPTVRELQTLVNCQQPQPWVDPPFNTGCQANCGVTACSCTVPDQYWSSTDLPNDSHQPGIHNQIVKFGPVDVFLGKFRLHYARAVRGATPTFRFVDNGDGTISDHQTGLMWEKKGDDGSVHGQDNRYTLSTGPPWNADGTVFTQFLPTLNHQAFAGYSDWRLPTVQELETLVSDRGCVDNLYIDYVFESTCSARACCMTSCPVTTTACSCTGRCQASPCQVESFYSYWSATDAADISVAFTVNFYPGIGSDTKRSSLYARAVRSG